MLKDENFNCRKIALDALKEKNGYQEPVPPCFVVARATGCGWPCRRSSQPRRGHRASVAEASDIPAEHRHLGFLTEGLENQENEDPGSTRDSRSAREALRCEAQGKPAPRR